jgi:hypothetical protein
MPRSLDCWHSRQRGPADCETVTSLHKAFGGDATSAIKHKYGAIVQDIL